MTSSFFEYLGIADMERVHSQLLAWIFSPDCSALNDMQKNQLLRNIFRLVGDSKIVNIYTERNNIDILIETDQDVMVVENKIKSSQHSNQLERYKAHCESKFKEHKKYYYFLTLIGEYSVDENWKKISYSQIYAHLDSLSLKEGENHTVIINEYLLFLKSLITVVEDFKINYKQYDIVFLDGRRKKEDKIDTTRYSTENEKFIAKNQLETILQKSFLSHLVKQVNTSNGLITDTRGSALVNFPLKERIEYEGNFYATIIQLQDDTLKFAFAVIGEDYSKSDKNSLVHVIPQMTKLLSQNNYGYKRLNIPNSKAYVSISKKLNVHYWHKSIDDLANFIKVEIENGKLLTHELLALLNIK